MVAATKIMKRFYSDTFSPPDGFASSIRGDEVSAAEILAGGVRESDWSFPVLISTPDEDRQGDIVIPEGCDYSAYRESPIVYFEHQDIKFPVGKMRGPDGRFYFLVIPRKGILGRIWIRKPEAGDPSAFAEACKTVWVCVRDGLLNGVSPGFDPIGPVKELPSGGNLYKRWELLENSIVGVAAGRKARVIRDSFGPDDFDEQILKRFSPSVIKGLRTMTTATVAVAKHIRHEESRPEGHQWVLYNHDMTKVLGTHPSKEAAEKQEEAIKSSEHKKAAARVLKKLRKTVSGYIIPPEAISILKGLSESSGTEGGYTIPESEEGEGEEGEGEETKGFDEDDDEDSDVSKGIKERMKDYPEAEGHEVYFHPKEAAVWHTFPEGADEEHVKSIVADLGAVDGVKDVHSGTEKPKEEGYYQIYPGKERPEGEIEYKHEIKAQKRSKRIAELVKRGKMVYRMLRKGMFSWKVKKSVEDCVHAKVPKLIEEGYEQKQAIAIAYSMCGEKKGIIPSVAKLYAASVKKADDEEEGLEDGVDDDVVVDTAPNDTALDVTEDEGTGGPDGLELVQTAIENLEAALPRLEPERKGFWENIIKQIRDHGEETYPDEDFGGEDDKGRDDPELESKDEEPNEESLSDEMLARYKSYGVKKVKRVSIRRVKKSLQKDPEASEIVNKAANHLHEIGDMAAVYDKKGCVLKGYTASHHRNCRKLARDLDRLHGIITKDLEPKESENVPEPAKVEDTFDLDEIGPVVKGLSDSLAQMRDQLFTAAGKRRGA